MTKFTQNAERTIILALKDKPGTLKQLATRTGINYYSVRNAVHALNEVGAISTRGIATRNQVFILKENAAELYNLPTITIDNKKVSMVNLLAWAGNEQKSIAYGAVQALPRHVARILNLCTAIRQDISVTLDLKRIKKEMQTDLQALKKMVVLYEQIINNNSIWDADALNALTKHPEYDEEYIINTYRHYYPNG